MLKYCHLWGSHIHYPCTTNSQFLSDIKQRSMYTHTWTLPHIDGQRQTNRHPSTYTHMHTDKESQIFYKTYDIFYSTTETYTRYFKLVYVNICRCVAFTCHIWSIKKMYYNLLKAISPAYIFTSPLQLTVNTTPQSNKTTILLVAIIMWSGSNPTVRHNKTEKIARSTSIPCKAAAIVILINWRFHCKRYCLISS